jgi:hemerythrin
MELFTWDESFSVGIGEIDDQHKKLIRIINDLHRAVKEHKAGEVMHEIVGRMVDYTVFHFQTEEKYLERHAYPDLHAHMNAHAVFIEKARDLQKRASEGRLIVSIEVMNFLKDWLMSHILDADRKYSPFLRERGMK